MILFWRFERVSVEKRQWTWALFPRFPRSARGCPRLSWGTPCASRWKDWAPAPSQEPPGVLPTCQNAGRREGALWSAQPSCAPGARTGCFSPDTCEAERGHGYTLAKSRTRGDARAVCFEESPALGHGFPGLSARPPRGYRRPPPSSSRVLTIPQVFSF